MSLINHLSYKLFTIVFKVNIKTHTHNDLSIVYTIYIHLCDSGHVTLKIDKKY